MIKIAIILYTFMLGYYYLMPEGFLNEKMWPVYHVWDHLAGGGSLLWAFAFMKSVKYKVACFFTFLFSLFRLGWLLYCYQVGVPTGNTVLVMWLFMALIPVIYYTVFVPNGRLTNFLDKYLIKWHLHQKEI